jgi:hypothetical protein
VLQQLLVELRGGGYGLAPGSFAEQPSMHPLAPIRGARTALPREATVAFDVGCLAQHMAGATPHFRVYEPRSTIVPSSFYGMGFAAAALPAARAAATASASPTSTRCQARSRARRANADGVPAVLDFVVARERLLGSLEHYSFYPAELIDAARALSG